FNALCVAMARVTGASFTNCGLAPTILIHFTDDPLRLAVAVSIAIRTPLMGVVGASGTHIPHKTLVPMSLIGSFQDCCRAMKWAIRFKDANFMPRQSPAGAAG